MPQGRADITPVAAAFMSRTAIAKPLSKTHTDGERYTYHDNIIAEHRADGLYVTLAGWPTVTTLHRLSALPGVDAYFSQNIVRLNGKPWDGEFVRVADADGNPVEVPASTEPATRETPWNPGGSRARAMERTLPKALARLNRAR